MGVLLLLDLAVMHVCCCLSVDAAQQSRVRNDDTRDWSPPWSDPRTFAVAGLVPQALPNGLAIVAGSVRKRTAPLLQQDQPWEFRLDNGEP